MPESSIIYIVTRLFDFAEKLKAEHLEQAVLNGLLNARNVLDQHAYELSTFVPFRDTAQDTMRGADAARLIYEEDLERMKELFALIGYFDGVSKDEGICMEIGYAYARSKPILLIITDFLVYKLKSNPVVHFYYDPIIERMTGHLIRSCTLPQAESFKDRLLIAMSSLNEQISNEVTKLVISPRDYISPMPTKIAHLADRPVVLLEFGGGLFEWQRKLSSHLHDLIKQATNLDTSVTQRYLGNSQSAHEAGGKDIALALAADILVVCTDGEEMNAGSAALVGLGKALNKPIILYDSKATLSFAEGAQEMSRNLMIDCAASKVTSKFGEIPKLVEGVLSEGHV